MREKELEEILRDLQKLGKIYSERSNGNMKDMYGQSLAHFFEGGERSISEAIINLINKNKHMRFLRKQENAYGRYLNFD